MDNDNSKNPKSSRGAAAGKKPPRKAPARAPVEKQHEGDRIAKVMARVGLCSRRDAEIWIEQGRVAVNGEVLTSAAKNVTEADRVTVDGKPLATRERTRLFLFHKPRGLVTTDRDPEGRATVFDYIAEKFPALPRLMSIGRLDINTEGLLLLTNDGGLARVLELPSTGWLRRYRARANGVTDQAKLDTLSHGVTIDGIDYAGVEARLDRVQGANVWISLGLREGKNREVKRLLEHLGLGVNRLIRLSYGPFQLGEMAEGVVEEVKTRILADQLGETLAREANVDFEGPVIDRTPEPEPERRSPRDSGPRPKRPAERGERSDKPERKSFASQEKAEPRKHVSALRSDRAKAEKGPRRRTERDATEDRKGRKVVVERVSNVQRAEPAGDTRNARRFREERQIREEGPKPFAAGRKREFRAEKPAGDTGAAKVFRRGAVARDDRPGGNGERPRGPGRSFGDKPSGGKDFRPRGEGRSFGDKPAGGKEFRPRAEGRSFGDKPAGGRPSGGGKSFGDRPSGGKTFGAKSFGGKPAGGKPTGPRKPRGK
jgi:23S rRNA pseudouridine2605 synthase